MTTMKKQMAFPLAAMTAALLVAYGPAHAQQDEEMEQLTKPSSSVAVGLGYLSEDAPRFGQYTGLNDQGGYGLVNIDVNKRDAGTGTSTRLNGRNLGLESRDLRFMQERHGDWAYYLDYSELPRFEPYSVNTAVTGIGGPKLAVPNTSTTGAPIDLKIKREALGLGYSKILGHGFDLQVRARSEEKDGARIFSRGYTPPSGVAWEFTPEPINSTTRQLDAILGYNTQKLYLAGSYYGTWYNNHNTALDIDGGRVGIRTIGLPPDTQSHQLALTGNYAFTPSTRANFKAAYTRATQDDQFINGGVVAAGIDPNGNLDGRVDTTLLQFGISSRPTSGLSLLADVRYEDRDDKTPVRLYTTGTAPTATFDGYNEPRDITTTAGKLEASYQLPAAMRLTAGVEYVEKERNDSPFGVRVVSYRKTTEETSYRLMLQRSMAETVSGSITYVFSEREGSDFQTNVLKCGLVTCVSGTTTSTAFNLIAPLHLADRERNKLRLSLNWTPVEQLSVQVQTEKARDNYDPRPGGEQLDLGLRDGKAENHSIDVSYALSDEWQTNAWVSKNKTTANRAHYIGPVNATFLGTTVTHWSSTLVNDATSFGFGLRGKPSSKLEVGVDLSHSEIDDTFQQQRISGGAVIESLPAFYTRQSTAKLFGTYAVQKNASIRLDYIYDRYSSNDWTWSRWTYSDGTTLTQQPRQNVSFVGLTYIYRFY